MAVFTNAPERMLTLDCPTRWNSTYDMLCICLAHSEVINRAIDADDSLLQYQLSKEEWEHLRSLTTLLKAFNDYHLSISSSSEISSFLVLLVFHSITSAVKDYQAGNAEYETFRRASFRKLVAYEKKIRSSPLYALAMLLDPRQKDTAFVKIGWSQLEINVALEDLKRYFIAYSQICGQASSVQVIQRKSKTSELFKDFFNNEVRSRSTNELSQYFHESHTDNDPEDPLEYWKRNSIKYPVLSRMARDIFAIPATSCATERMFSTCRDHLGVRRNRLSEKSFRALMFLGGNGFGID